ncbi:hypothetical protein Hanom_Chr06g00486921 [Helianthus anomalus]
MSYDHFCNHFSTFHLIITARCIKFRCIFIIRWLKINKTFCTFQAFHKHTLLQVSQEMRRSP